MVDAAHNSEWPRRVEATERVNRFAEETGRLRRAFEKHDRHTLDSILQVLTDMYEAAERERAAEIAARKKLEDRAFKNFIVSVVSLVAGVAIGAGGIVVGLVT